MKTVQEYFRNAMRQEKDRPTASPLQRQTDAYEETKASSSSAGAGFKRTMASDDAGPADAAAMPLSDENRSLDVLIGRLKESSDERAAQIFAAAVSLKEARGNDREATVAALVRDWGEGKIAWKRKPEDGGGKRSVRDLMADLTAA